VRFHKATRLCGEDIAAVQRAVRRRVLWLFQRRDLLTPEDTAEMLPSAHGGGFSLDATVHVAAHNRKEPMKSSRWCVPIDHHQYHGAGLSSAARGPRLRHPDGD
jgi:hypothetical protein